MHIGSKRRIRVETKEASREAREEDMEEKEAEDTVGEEAYHPHASTVEK